MTGVDDETCMVRGKPAGATGKVRLPWEEIDGLMASLEVEVIALSQCLVSAGHRLELGANEAPGLHYILSGTGRMTIAGQRKVELAPHTLVVMPPHVPFSIEMPGSGRAAMAQVNGRDQDCSIEGVRRFTAGDGEPRLIMVCGYFQARYGSAIDIFGRLRNPIVEQFAVGDKVDQKLAAAVEELVTQEIGAGAMSAVLLKQVILMLLRRSVGSMALWVERFAVLSDPQVSRALARMVADPGAPHTVTGLAETAFLSRSAFMARFSDAVGQSPMLMLRDLRMRQAATELASGAQSVERISRNVGYASKSSFVRAFKAVYGTDPAAYRATHRGA